jgi:small GTP-binding protein
MATINYALREISVKIVYYGTGLCGKTTNLQVIHRKVPTEFRSDMVSLATETDRTLFFDFLPLDLGKIKGFSTKFQLYTVPGQVYYNATRKLVLRGVDGVIFVVDSAAEKLQENIESFKNLEENLAEYGYYRENIPIILQYNKRDLPTAMPVDKLNSLVNKYGLPASESIALQGKGVFESLKMMGKMVIDNLNKKYSRPGSSPAPSQPAPSREPFMQPAASRPSPSQQRPMPAAQPAQKPQHRPSTQPRRPAPAPSPVDDPFQDAQPASYEPPLARSKSAEDAVHPKGAVPSKPLQPKASGDYYEYGSINLEPISEQSAAEEQPENGQNPAPSSRVDKTDLDLEIERYQREIEDKQRRQRPSPSSQQSPGHQQPYSPSPRPAGYEVYEPMEAQEEQTPPAYQSPPAAEDASAEEQPLYFTSVNTDRQRKKIKRPVNPKTRQQGNFLSKFFSKDKS